MTHSELIRMSVEGRETTVSLPSDSFNALDSSDSVSQQLCQLIESEPPLAPVVERLNLDFKNVERLGSAGLNGLIGLKSKARSRGVRVVLMNVKRSVREVFVVTRLERTFEFASTATPSI